MPRRMAADGHLALLDGLRAHNEAGGFVCTKATPSLHPGWGLPRARRRHAAVDWLTDEGCFVVRTFTSFIIYCTFVDDNGIDLFYNQGHPAV